MNVSVARKCTTGPLQSNKAKTLHNVCLKEKILRLLICNKHPILRFFKKSAFVTLDPKPEGIVGEILNVSVARKCTTGPWQSNKAKTLHNVCLKEKILRLLTCNTLKIKIILDGCCQS